MLYIRVLSELTMETWSAEGGNASLSTHLGQMNLLQCPEEGF